MNAIFRNDLLYSAGEVTARRHGRMKMDAHGINAAFLIIIMHSTGYLRYQHFVITESVYLMSSLLHRCGAVQRLDAEIKTPSAGNQGLPTVFSYKPGVGQNVALRASRTARNSVFMPSRLIQLHSFLILFKYMVVTYDVNSTSDATCDLMNYVWARSTSW